MAQSPAWRLKHYARFIPRFVAGGSDSPWKVFEATDKKPAIIFTIVDYGYLMVLQGEESLDAIPLLSTSNILKIHQKSDNLILWHTVNGKSRLIRMQFHGSSRAKATQECSTAVEKLNEYRSVSSEDDVPSAPVIQGKAGGGEPEAVQGSLSIRRLTQHFLGQSALTLPRVYSHDPVEQGDLEPILRVCLLDPSFPAFVEMVEGELKKLLQQGNISTAAEGRRVN